MIGSTDDGALRIVDDAIVGALRLFKCLRFWHNEAYNFATALAFVAKCDCYWSHSLLNGIDYEEKARKGTVYCVATANIVDSCRNIILRRYVEEIKWSVNNIVTKIYLGWYAVENKLKLRPLRTRLKIQSFEHSML